MTGPLARIAQDAQQVTEAIRAAFGIDAEVVDRELRIVAGTGLYAQRLGAFEEGAVGGGLYGRVLASGMTEAALDTSDPSYDPIVSRGGVVPEQADFAAPILLHGAAVGIVGLIAFTEDQLAIVRLRSEAILDFCRRLADLLASRLVAIERLEALEAMQAHLQLIQDHVDEGILLVGRSGDLLLISAPARELLGCSGSERSWQDLFLSDLPPAGQRVRLQPRRGELLLADARWLPEPAGLLVILRSVEAMQQLAYALTYVHTRVPVAELAGRTNESRRLRSDVVRLAPAATPVLIWGEPGAGASAVASALHDNGPRRDGPFVSVPIDPAAEDALERTIFGSPGETGNVGALALASGGSLHLDHVDRLPLGLQERLLETMRTGSVTLGSHRRPLACRIIATTTTRLSDAVRRGDFLGDLYGHLSQGTIRLTPLRRRKGDIPDLAQAFLDRRTHEPEKTQAIDPGAMRLLLAHSWPGNLRELRAVIEVAARGDRAFILPEHLPQRLQREARMPERPLDEMSREFEASVILPLLGAFGSDTGGKRKVAEHLGISLATLYRKLKNFDISP